MIPTHLVIHHSASGTELTFEQIRAHHIERGWDDIGYHFVIDVKGQVFAGRGESTVGAHALGINQHSLGICCIGNFEEHAPSTEQVSALHALVRDLVMRHNISVANIIGHCDVTCAERDDRRSLCPGKFLYAAIDLIRKSVVS